MKQIRNSNYSSGNSVRQLEIVVAVDLALLGTQNKGTSVGAIVVVDAVRLEFLYAVDCFSGILYEVGEMGSGNKSKIKGIGYRNSNKRNIQNKDMPKLIT